MNYLYTYETVQIKMSLLYKSARIYTRVIMCYIGPQFHNSTEQ